MRNGSDSADSVNRRDFLKKSGATGLGLAIGSMILEGKEIDQAQTNTVAPAGLFTTPPLETVRVGFVGVGQQGRGHFSNLLRIEGVQIKAVCDLLEDRVKRAQDQVEKAGKPRPAGYFNGPEDFKRMCDKEELDLVYTAIPWEWHVPVCVKAMETGKHTATEVPGAITRKTAGR